MVHTCAHVEGRSRDTARWPEAAYLSAVCLLASECARDRLAIHDLHDVHLFEFLNARAGYRLVGRAVSKKECYIYIYISNKIIEMGRSNRGPVGVKVSGPQIDAACVVVVVEVSSVARTKVGPHTSSE
jgi:hypothetical protein